MTRPNVVLVLADDQGYGDVGRHGHPVLRTPELDRLHDESVRLRDFHAYPMCTPTRGSLLTGRDAMAHGALNVSSGRSMLRPELPMLSERLREGGYRTALFGKWHLGDDYPYRPQDRGFDDVAWFPSSHIGSAPDRWETDYFDPWLRTLDGVEQASGYCTDVFTDRAIDWMTQRVGAGEPFFAYLALNAPHSPYLVDERYRAPYAEHGHELATYFGMLANIDENMGRLDRALHDLGVADDTIVVYLSDNGGSHVTTGVYNAGMRGHKTELWEGGHRVPFFVRWPGGGIGGPGRGRDVDALTVAQDFMPTLLSLCGVASDAASDGVDLSEHLVADDAAPDTLDERVAVMQYSRMGAMEPTYGDAAVMWRRWRLMWDAELYDLDADPGQTTDVADAHPDVVAALREHYRTWWGGVAERAKEFLDVVVGAEAQETALLSPCEWRGTFLDQQRQIRLAFDRNGEWGLRVERAGRYRFSLRRWPEESGLPMRAPAPEFVGGDCTYPEGVAMPVAEAELRVGERTERRAVADDDVEAAFEVELAAGPTTAQSWFRDADGAELSGAYYVYVERVHAA